MLNTINLHNKILTKLAINLVPMLCSNRGNVYSGIEIVLTDSSQTVHQRLLTFRPLICMITIFKNSPTGKLIRNTYQK